MTTSLLWIIAKYRPTAPTSYLKFYATRQKQESLQVSRMIKQNDDYVQANIEPIVNMTKDANFDSYPFG